MLHYRVRVLLTPADGGWRAQCLEYDEARTGATIDEAVSRVTLALLTRIHADEREGREPLSTLPVAPPEVWDRYPDAPRLAEPSPPATLETTARTVVACEIRVA